MTRENQEVLLEAATTAFRERDPSGRIKPSPEWWDLSPEDRELLFQRQLQSCLLERAIHPSGLSTSARTVLERIPHLTQFFEE